MFFVSGDQCGSGIAKCSSSSQLRSQFGGCGQTSAHCSIGCPSDFRKCNGDNRQSANSNKFDDDDL